MSNEKTSITEAGDMTIMSVTAKKRSALREVCRVDPRGGVTIGEGFTVDEAVEITAGYLLSYPWMSRNAEHMELAGPKGVIVRMENGKIHLPMNPPECTTTMRYWDGLDLALAPHCTPDKRRRF